MQPDPIPAPLHFGWHWAAFESLSVHELYAVLQLRSAVFVAEQQCPYLDLDDADQPSMHLLGWRSDAGRTESQTSGKRSLVAALRLVPPGVKYEEPSIGRVVTALSARRFGLGRALMQEGIRKCSDLYPDAAIRIGAQAYLEKFYQSLGFETVSPPYDEDGIVHLEMLRPASAAVS